MTQTVIEMAEAAEEFIRAGKWAADTPQYVRDMVAMNIRGFWSYLHSESLVGCEQACNEACNAAWHRVDVIRGIPVYVCADEFTEDKSTGIRFGPEQVYAIRRDDGTAFELTQEETEAVILRASEEQQLSYDME